MVHVVSVGLATGRTRKRDGCRAVHGNQLEQTAW